MSTILLTPDFAEGMVNFCGSMKPFIIGSEVEVAFTLAQGETIILDEVYMPTLTELTAEELYGGPGGGNGSLVWHVRIDVHEVIDRLLDVVIPANGVLLTTQTTGVGDFTASIDGNAIVFRVIKGGVAELNLLTATPWLELNWLTWQPQDKEILQMAPEWLGIYTIASGGSVMATAYFTDGSSYTGTFASLSEGNLYTLDTSWPKIASWSGGEPAAWDVWFGTLPVQRYRLRYPNDEEHLFVWGNTLGGVDSFSFTGYCEEDEKLDHKNLLYNDEIIAEYDLNKPREYRQATGYLTEEERLWIKDFYYSKKKYRVRPDGSFGGVFTVKAIAVIASKVISSSQDDEVNFEFTYRLGVDEQLLNLDRTLGALPPPEGMSAFFLTDLIPSLTEASYAENLLMAVQSPYAVGWQKLSLEQLWGGGLPLHIDGTTIRIINGRLTAFASGGDIDIINQIVNYLESINITYNNSQTILIYGAMLWQSGLTYTSTDTVVYRILGTKYIATRQTLTLDSSDETFARIDVFYADTTQNIRIMKGVAATYPLKPVIPETVGVEVGSVLLEPQVLEPSNALVEKVYDEHVPAEWTTSSVKDLDVLVDFDNLLAPVAGSKRIQVAIESLNGAPEHYIGEAFHGGIIFKLFTPTTGLIAAGEDTALDKFYESLSGLAPFTTGANGVVIGTGQSNSEILINNAHCSGQAIKYCDELLVSPYDDWYLPSEDELYEMYINRYKIGGFATKTYWSSTEVTGVNDWNTARCIDFSDGTTYDRLKNNRYAVRAIRTFDDFTDLPDPNSGDFVSLENTILTFFAPEPKPTNYGILSFNIKSSLPWRENSMIRIEAYLQDVRVGVVTMSRGTNMFSYRPGDNVWRMLAIQMYMFAPTDNWIDCFRFTFLGSWPNHLDLGLDDIRYQHGLPGTQEKQEAHRHTDYGFRELPDGYRMVFNTIYPYIKHSTEISQNGVRQIKGDYQHYIEWNDQIYFFYPPEATGAFVVDYLTLVPEPEDNGSGSGSGGYQGSGSGN